MKHTIEAYLAGTPECAPWRVRIDGKADPVNREFADKKDIVDTFALLMANGFYEGFELIIPEGRGL